MKARGRAGDGGVLRVASRPDGDLSWRDAAVCQQTDPEVFHPEAGEPNAKAKSVCRGCTVREDCLAYTLSYKELWGIWGGFSKHERALISREHAAGRSLADIIADDDARFYAKQDALADRGATPQERRLTRQREKRRSKAQRLAGSQAGGSAP